MRFSILVPSYRTEVHLIKRCIESIRNQKTKYGQPFYDMEIIVSCGKQTLEYPETFKYLKSIKGLGGIKLVEVDHPNVSKSRNACLDLAQGDWIVWCDSDDTLQPFALDTLEDYIISLGHKYDCFCYKANIYGEKLDYAKSMIDNYVGDYVFTDLCSSNEHFFKVPEVLWRKCIKRQFIVNNNIRFDDEIKLYDDWYFHNLLCLRLSKAYKIDKALYNYFIRENSLSTESEKENKRTYIYRVRDKVWEKLKPFIGNSETYLQMYSQRLDDYCDKFVEGI